ncbi:hypothetical protein FM119_04155 [Mycetocola reblochoni REB411]|uniref:Uncharacterized protein n=1 Tax=Mycetocola reblochoni REB411 TaxID=1255698 RepID=A0A1R4IXM9_9MICO|nr:hypothetical protein FM119_04155 [Mycetocola reblochoni REB411]
MALSGDSGSAGHRPLIGCGTAWGGSHGTPLSDWLACSHGRHF